VSEDAGVLPNCWYESWFMLSPPWRMDLPSGRKDRTRIQREHFDYNNRSEKVSNGKAEI